MNIGLDIRAIGRRRTGDESYTLGVVRALIEQDRENKYFLYTDTKDKEEIEKIESLIGDLAENFKIVPVLPASKLIWTLVLLPLQAKKDKLDILHVQYVAPIFLDKKISLVVTIHDVSFLRYPKFIKFKDLLLLLLFVRPSLWRADRIVAISEFTKSEIKKYYKSARGKISAIHNGYDEEIAGKLFSFQEIVQFKEDHNLKNPYLLYVGTLQPRKNIPFLIRAFADIKKNNQDDLQLENLELVLSGSRESKNYDKRIDKAISSIASEKIRNSVKIIGFIPQDILHGYYQGAVAYVNASLYEGFGIPLIEAMALGVPVVCSDSSCFPEVVGDGAELFKNNDQNSFSFALSKVIKDVERKGELCSKGMERSGHFSWEKNAMQTLKLYDTLNKARSKAETK